MRFITFLLLVLLVLNNGFGQVDEVIVLPNELKPGRTITELISDIEDIKGISISYSSSQFTNNKINSLPQGKLNLTQFFENIFPDYTITVKKVNPSKYILTLKDKFISFSGYITDEDGEPIPGAVIIDKISGTVASADDKGFYFINLKVGNIDFEVKMFSYQSQDFKGSSRVSLIQNFKMVYDGYLPTLVVDEKPLKDPLTDLMYTSESIGKLTVFGEEDPLNMLKTSPGVTPGSEGSIGISVRGGSSDHNLVLYDGMPLYETQHSGNMASLFVDESIRSIDFMKSGLSARYGGRLGSLINVQLKDGSTKKASSSINLGIQGITFFTEGPIIKDKLTYSFSFRNSIINTFINAFKNKISVYDDIDVGYRDLNTKISYKFSNSGRLSLTAYFGNDRLLLEKLNKQNNIQSSVGERNLIRSKNRIISLNYDHLIKKNLKYNFQAGLLNYEVFSRGSYNFLLNFNDTIKSNLDVINNTYINDVQVTSNLDYYYNDNIKIRAGIGLIGHQYNPAVKQGILNTINKQETILDRDSIIPSKELFYYSEANFKYKKFIISPGVYVSRYFINKISIPSVQPRFLANYSFNDKLLAQGSLTYSTQFVHLLTNSGLGLPSELWVPTTNNIPAEKIVHLSFGIRYFIQNKTNVSIAYYHKKFDNILDYIEPVDNFLNIVNGSSAIPILNSQRDWERKTTVGRGRAYGVELSWKQSFENLNLWFSYHYGRSFRKFESINDGKEFSSKNDKPHNISTGFNMHLGKSWNISGSWSFSSGQPFTLADEIFFNPINQNLEFKFIQATSRNNYRLPDFHQLTISTSKKFRIKEIDSELNLGVYNLYNRKNAFYIYAVELPDKFIFKKVSIYPILPQINIKFKW